MIHTMSLPLKYLSRNKGIMLDHASHEERRAVVLHHVKVKLEIRVREIWERRLDRGVWVIAIHAHERLVEGSLGCALQLRIALQSSGWDIDGRCHNIIHAKNKIAARMLAGIILFARQCSPFKDRVPNKLAGIAWRIFCSQIWAAVILS